MWLQFMFILAGYLLVGFYIFSSIIEILSSLLWINILE